MEIEGNGREVELVKCWCHVAKRQLRPYNLNLLNLTGFSVLVQHRQERRHHAAVLHPHLFILGRWRERRRVDFKSGLWDVDSHKAGFTPSPALRWRLTGSCGMEALNRMHFVTLSCVDRCVRLSRHVWWSNRWVGVNEPQSQLLSFKSLKRLIPSDVLFPALLKGAGSSYINT